MNTIVILQTDPAIAGALECWNDILKYEKRPTSKIPGETSIDINSRIGRFGVLHEILSALLLTELPKTGTWMPTDCGISNTVLTKAG